MPNRAVGYPVEIRGKGTKKHQEWVRQSKMRLKAGKAYRSQNREQYWAQSEDQYMGDHWDEIESAETLSDLIVVNMSFSTANTIVPYMTGSEPNFLVLPLGEGADPRNAAIQQSFLNRIWRAELEGQDELEAAAHDFVTYGDGYLKGGYEMVEKRTDLGAYSTTAKLWVKKVSPWDVWIEPYADGTHNARWVAHRLRLTRPEVEAMFSKNLDSVNYSKYETVDPDEHGSNRTRDMILDETEYAEIYEFYDMVEGYCVTFAESGDVPLKVVEDVPVLPIVQMGNYRIPNSPYHMGELEQLWDIQQELNKARTQMTVHRARNAQKFLAQKGTIDPDAREALKSQVVNEVVEVDTNGAPLDNIISPAQVPGLSADVYNVSEILERDIYEISGVSEYLRGGTPTVRRTATEATIIEGASNVKSQFKLRQVEKAARRLGTLLLGFAADVYPKTDYDELQLYLTGRDAELVARNSSPEDLVDDFGNQLDPRDVQSAVFSPRPEIWTGTYEVLVEQASTELRSPALREQKYRGIVMDLIQAVPLLQNMGVFLDLRKLLILWFEAAGIDDVEGLFMGPRPQVGPEPGRVDTDLYGDLADPAVQGILGQLTGLPNLNAEGAPEDVISPDNSGILPPSDDGQI